MPKTDTEIIAGIGQRWIRFRKEWQSKTTAPNAGDVKKFVEHMTGLSREFQSALDVTSLEIAEAIFELAGHMHADMKREAEAV